MTRKWTADGLVEQLRGYGPACVITAAADLDLFTALGHVPMTADHAARYS